MAEVGKLDGHLYTADYTNSTINSTTKRKAMKGPQLQVSMNGNLHLEL